MLPCLRVLALKRRTGSLRLCGIRMRAPFALDSSRFKLALDLEARSGFCGRGAATPPTRLRANVRSSRSSESDLARRKAHMCIAHDLTLATRPQSR